MTQQEFFNEIENFGIDLDALRIEIGSCNGWSGAHGIYEKAGQWIYYYADERNHIDEETIDDEEEAFDKMFREVFIDLRAKKYLSMMITKDIVRINKQTVCQFICKTYSMSEQQAENAWNMLKQDMHLLFEFKYYVANNAFIPEKYCHKIKGYSAERISKIADLSPLAAYKYMMFLDNKPAEALADLEVRADKELKPYQGQIQSLWDKGMYYSGVKKSFAGKVDRNSYFNIPGLIVNTFGYYQNDDNTWIAFVTDEERGLEDTRKKLSSEEEAIEYLINLTESYNFSHYYHIVINNFTDGEKIIINHLKQKYNYSEDKTKKTLNYLLQVKVIAFEYWYFITHGDYVPDKVAENYSGYTAKRLKQETGLTELGAFNYMVYLKRKPEEALANLKKGLPRRKLFSPQDVEDLKKYMD